MIKWKTSGNDGELIEKIAARALEMGINDNEVEVMMDITAVHLNDVEFRLAKVVRCRRFQFWA